MLWLIPGGVIGIISVVLYLAMGEENAAGYLKETFDNSGHLEVYTASIYQLHFFVNMILYYIFLSIQVFVILVVGTIQLFTPKGFLRSFFNNSASQAMRQNRVVLIGMWALLLIILTAFLGEYYLSIDFHGVAHYFIAISGLIFFYLGYNVCFRTTPEQIVPTEVAASIEIAPGGNEISPSEKVPNVPTRLIPILDRFNLLMNDKVYLKKNIRVEDVADMIHTNRTYVSKLLKEEFGCNFVDYINRKRIEYACELMHTSPGLTQEQIAEMAGFAHASSFSRSFKQYTGMTFREMRK